MTSSAKSILDIPYTSSFPVSALLPSSGQYTQVLDMMRFYSSSTYNPADVAQIRALINAIPGEISRYDNQLASRGRFSEVVVADRATLQNVLDRCKSAITSPIRKLPTEVLLLIFRECRLAADESCDHVLEEDRDRATLKAYRRLAGGDLANIAQVCHQWNMLVDSDPLLWSSITMDMRSWETQGEIEDVPGWLVQAWMLLHHALKRGGGLPVDVEAVVPRCHPLPVFALAHSSARWRSANIHIDPVMSTCLEAVHHHLPLLEKLHLRFIRENVREGLKDITKFFSDAPQLKELAYCGPINVLQHLPMEQLRRFSCSMLVPADVLPWTSLLPRLSDGVVHTHLNVAAFSDDDEPLQLSLVESSLHELSITATNPTGSGTGQLSQRVLGGILEALKLPSLVH
ncbi:hypothetical protein R3P38DRAFT_3253017, partial [Favolaschia claudopus]